MWRRRPWVWAQSSSPRTFVGTLRTWPRPLRIQPHEISWITRSGWVLVNGLGVLPASLLRSLATCHLVFWSANGKQGYSLSLDSSGFHPQATLLLTNFHGGIGFANSGRLRVEMVSATDQLEVAANLRAAKMKNPAEAPASICFSHTHLAVRGIYAVEEEDNADCDPIQAGLGFSSKKGSTHMANQRTLPLLDRAL